MTVVRLHAGTVTDYGTSFGAGGGLTGSGALWDDASDSTYLTSQAIPSTTIAQGSAQLDQLALPAGATVTDVTFNTRVQQTAGAYQTHFSIIVEHSAHTGGYGPTDPSGDVKGISIPSSGSILNFTTVATDFGSWSVGSLAGLVTLLSSSDCIISARNVPDRTGGGVAIASTIRVYELSVDVTYAAPATGMPPIRQYPRQDGLGASSAPRHYPIPRSTQASPRRAGGYT